MDEAVMSDCVCLINRKKPVQIWAYAESACALAEAVLRRGQPVHCPRNIVTTAGVLYSDMRETIQKAFPHTRVLNQYGSREVGPIGVEVGADSPIRVFDHSILLEVLTDTGEIRREGAGRLIVTSLTNYAMPLIRFDIGDIGTVSPAGDHGGFSLLRELKGRVNAHLKRADGTLVHGEYFTVYSNLASVQVKNGDKIAAGQTIGHIPDTADSNDYFLHFEIWKNTANLNPEQWFAR